MVAAKDGFFEDDRIARDDVASAVDFEICFFHFVFSVVFLLFLIYIYQLGGLMPSIKER